MAKGPKDDHVQDQSKYLVLNFEPPKHIKVGVFLVKKTNRTANDNFELKTMLSFFSSKFDMARMLFS